MPSASVRRRRTITVAALVVALVLSVAAVAFARRDAAPAQAAERPAPATSAPGTPAPSTADPATPAPSASPSAPASASPKPSASPSSRTASGEPITLAFGGDVHFEPPLAGRLAADPRTVLGPYATKTLSSADLAMVNLETAITDGGGQPAPKQFTFAAPRSAFTALTGAGVDVTSMANNHGLDFGASQIPIAQAAARKAGVTLLGIGADEEQAYAPALVTVKGQRVAIIAATQVLDDAPAWTAGPDKPGLASAKRVDRLTRAVRDVRPEADLVVVFLHWGRELAECPTDVQRTLQGQLEDAGADVIVGSHAHVLLGGGWTPGGAYVDYGLGNFAFYANRPAATESGMLVLTAQGSEVTKARWVPARISGGVPRTPSAADAAAISAAKSRLARCADLRSTPPKRG
jgi:poly-gamma-glutamate synthesis protein (capsule biosynthesis protein)